MKYIVSKVLNINNFLIKETNDIYKIIYSDNNIEMYGMIIELKFEKFIDNKNNFEFIIDDDNCIFKYINYLNSKICNLKPIIYNNIFKTFKYDKIKNKLINNETIYINIGYVRKNYFFNIPHINII